MKLLLLISFVYCAFAFVSERDAALCNSDCIREGDCACASTTSPINTKSTPQLVTLTFDDSVSASVYDEYYSKLLLNRNNPDGNPITATFYVPHPYTDYEKVNLLYNKGFDIAAHSVSKSPVDYWRNATEEELIREFEDNRKIIAKFANIPIDDIIGVRTPHLELAGDKTFKAYTHSGFVYDSSFTALSTNPLFPFTAEYKIDQPCLIGSCPTESYPHFWINPIVNLKGVNNFECNALLACQITGSAEEIRDWLIRQFERVYNENGNRAPITFMVNSVWFQAVENSFQGFEMFLNDLSARSDVFLVSHREVVSWSQKPAETGTYQTSHSFKEQSCNPVTCFLKFGEEERIMRSCVRCPGVFPWLGNPEGI